MIVFETKQSTNHLLLQLQIYSIQPAFNGVMHVVSQASLPTRGVYHNLKEDYKPLC